MTPPDILSYAVLGVVAYLLGSVPVALIMSAVLKRTDLRRIGSGNLGVLNTMFNVGKLPGLLTIVGHGILAALTVFLAGWFPEAWFPAEWRYPGDWWVPVRDDVGLMVAMAGLTAGNMWQLFAKFRGSRGSTTVGWALLVAAPLMLLVLFGVWLAAILALRRNVPAARVLHAAIPVVFGLMQGSWTFAIGGAVIAVLLTLKVAFSGDDATALGVYRRFGINENR